MENPTKENYVIETRRTEPTLFPLSIVTWAMTKQSRSPLVSEEVMDDVDVGVGDIFNESSSVEPTIHPEPIPVPKSVVSEIDLFSKEDLVRELRIEPSLSDLRKLAVLGEEALKSDSSNYWEKDLLKKKLGSLKSDHLLVLPTPFRNLACKFAHDSPQGGHLGQKKTFRKIAKHFTWPK
nr:uncharacterized protein LOC128694759 [Cherax quadricarinatus]